MKSSIYCVEKNIHGAWVIYGEIGIRQYYFYTKKDAVADYAKRCRKAKIVNERRLQK